VRNNVLADAPQNVLVAWKSHDNLIERNLMIRQDNGTWSQPWYPNIRGLSLSGSGNRALLNGGYGADSVISNHNDSSQPVADLGGNVRLGSDVASARTCDALRAHAEELGIFGPEPDTRRRAGASRIDTSVVLSQTAFPDGASNVLIARADVYADALAGAALAGTLEAPLLLSDSAQLTPATLAEIRRLKSATAYLLGGENSLSASVRRTLQDEGLEVTRVSGPDRYSTAAAVAALTPTTSLAYVVEGANDDPNRGWPDAVASSALAATTKRPVLLVTRDGLPAATADALDELGITEVVIIGGPGSVSGAVASRIEDPDGDGHEDRKVTRVSGESRYDTSAAVADHAVAAGASTDRTWLVTGTNWPDALAAGAAAAQVGANLLLVHGNDARHSSAALNWLAEHESPDRALTLVGGPGSLTYTAEATLAFAYD
jgi:putative cell wall-binding protein